MKRLNEETRRAVLDAVLFFKSKRDSRNYVIEEKYLLQSIKALYNECILEEMELNSRVIDLCRKCIAAWKRNYYAKEFGRGKFRSL